MQISMEQRCLLWLSSAEIQPSVLERLTSRHQGVEGVWEAFGKRGGPEFPPSEHKVLKSLHSDAAIDGLLERLERINVRLLFPQDPYYPEQLRAIDDPPYLLYYAGDLESLKMPMLTIIGARRCSSYGREVAFTMARDLCKAGMCVVSGLARGIDCAAHLGALEAGGRTVGILGSGINVPYPPEHAPMFRQIAGGIGLILSEYPLDAEPKGFHFPFRNRIMSGLSLGVVFVEGQVRSGSMHTVSAALAQGREVFAVPGRVGTEVAQGPHTVIREGARLVTSAADILEDLGLETQPCETGEDETISLTDIQREILRQLGVEALDVQELSRRLDRVGSELLGELGTLEILGLIRREAGNRFCLSLQTGNRGGV